MIEVLYVNNEGGGFCSKIPVEAGTSISAFLASKLSEPTASYNIRVNGQPCAFDDILEQNDRIVVTPLKVAGGSN